MEILLAKPWPWLVLILLFVFSFCPLVVSLARLVSGVRIKRIRKNGPPLFYAG